MIDTNNLCFGQRIDEKFGILEPWYTHGALDRINTWDLQDKVVIEWGGGASTLWWAVKSKVVYSVDHSNEWVYKVREWLLGRNLEDKSEIRFVQTHEGDHSEKRNEYVGCYPNIKPDICIVDGIHRYECAEYAVKVLKPEILIVDNHQQDYVFMCPALDELLKGVKMDRFIQQDHKEHSGNPWATAIFYLNGK